ncbi:MAG: hypothetical protein QOI31_2974 [Solirubrobacterales bacterium]|nr:hypothetical protein [Solirubrobacterales bacterium]
MRKLITCSAAVVALAVPSAALAGNAGDGSGYHPNPNASDCGQYHGAFGAFGKDYNFAGGADGQATGDANSAKGCQKNQP